MSRYIAAAGLWLCVSFAVGVGAACAQDQKMPPPKLDPGAETRPAWADELLKALGRLEVRLNQLTGAQPEASILKNGAPKNGATNGPPQPRETRRPEEEGRLILRNQTGVEQCMIINGECWRIPAGNSYVLVPLGVVTAHHICESSKTWTGWKEKDGEQQLVIGIR